MRVFILLAMLGFGLHAQAVTPEELLNGVWQSPRGDACLECEVSPFRDLMRLGFGLNRDYQIGDEWGKKPVTQADLDSNPSFKRMALATAKIRSGGTGFFLGEFNGDFVVASNHHVCPNENSCMGSGAVNFPLLNIRTDAIEFYGTWPEIDLSLFSIRLNAEQASRLKAVSSPFRFKKDVYHGELLVTIGFGVGNNPGRVLVANRDSDCKVYSRNAEYRLMGDPDDFNPGPYKAWSFANGCDVSHGDSGSAMMDRETGEVVGIIWTGRIPKNPKVLSRDYLDGIFANSSEDVWKELSYGVPATEMGKFLEALVRNKNLPEEYAPTIAEMLSETK